MFAQNLLFWLGRRSRGDGVGGASARRRRAFTASIEGSVVVAVDEGGGGSGAREGEGAAVVMGWEGEGCWSGWDGGGGGGGGGGMFRGGEDRGDGEEREERGPWRGWIAGEGVGDGVRASALGGVEMSEASLGATDAPGDRVGLCGRGAWRGLVTGTGGVKYFAIRAGSIAGSAGLRRERGQGEGEMLHEV